ncbi:MAG: alpha/beta hydrolase [Actinomycetota bacterium]
MRSTRVECSGGNGVRLVADAYGDPGHAKVLLLHGAGQNRHSWGGTASKLARVGFYAVSADIRGHGDSGWDPFGDYGLGVLRSDVEAWCAFLDRPALVGASMGGLAGLGTEGQRAIEGLPSAARALVLVDIAHRSEPEGVQRILDFMTGRPEGYPSLEEAADAVAEYLPHRPRPSLDGLGRNMRLGDDGRYRWHWDPALIDDRRGTTLRSARNDFEEHSRALNLPVLLVRGQMSDVLSEESAREFLSLVPHAEYIDVAGAHHMVAGDRNDAFTDPVVEFLHRVLPSAS